MENDVEPRPFEIGGSSVTGGDHGAEIGAFEFLRWKQDEGCKTRLGSIGRRFLSPEVGKEVTGQRIVAAAHVNLIASAVEPLSGGGQVVAIQFSENDCGQFLGQRLISRGKGSDLVARAIA